MRKSFLIILLFVFSCKEPTTYWNPQGNFPLLMENGTTSNTEKFSLESVPSEVKILVINFFAPDCKPCIMEVPDLKVIYNDIKDNPRVRFVAIGSRLTSLFDEEVKDASAVAPEILKFVKGYKLPYPSYIGITSDIKNYGLTGFPETFILYRKEDNKWFVKRKFIGMISEKDVKPFLHG